MNTQLASLQAQVDNLYASLNALRTSGDTATVPSSERSISVSQPSVGQSISPRNKLPPPPPKHPTYRGPTSSAFSLDVAKNTLHSMGYQGLGDEPVIAQDPAPLGSSPAAQPPPLPSINGTPRRDPLVSLNKDEVTRLCRVYEEEMGIMYPVVDIDEVIAHGATLYQYLDAATRAGFGGPQAPGHEGINDDQSLVLKMVLAAAMLTEGHGQSELGYRLFESVREAADRILHTEAIEVKNLPLLALVVSVEISLIETQKFPQLVFSDLLPRIYFTRNLSLLFSYQRFVSMSSVQTY